MSSLKYANAKNCDLRSAILAGADLEVRHFIFWTTFLQGKQTCNITIFHMFQQCNLSGSDLNEANLRGSNLTNTVLESMLSPLHMSQTIR